MEGIITKARNNEESWNLRYISMDERTKNIARYYDKNKVYSEAGCGKI